MTTATAVAKAVARDAEARARAALAGVMAAHAQLTDAEAAVAAAAAARASAAPALARAIDTALAAGITVEQLGDLGVAVPSERTRRRAARAAGAADTGPGPERPAPDDCGGQPADPSAGHW